MGSLRKILIITLVAFSVPSFAFAIPSSVDRIIDHIEPLIKTDYIKSQYFISTSTTQASLFPYASTTALSATTLCLSTDCRQSWPNTVGNWFTPNAGGYNSTSTVIGFLVGLFSNSTTTLNGGIRFPSLTNGLLGVGQGTVYSTATGTLTLTAPLSGGPFTVVGTGGAITCPTCSTATFGYPFTPGTFGPLGTSATGTPLQVLSAAAGFIASSTSWLDNLRSINSTSTNATTTTFAITGTASNCNGTNALTTLASGQVTCTAQPQGTVTSVAGTFPIQSTGGATPNISFVGLTTTTPWTTNAGQLAWVVGNNTVSSVATGTLSFTSPLSGGPFIVVGTGGSVTCPTCVTSDTVGAWFTPTNNFNLAANSTSTQIWFRGPGISLSASSTAWFEQLNVGSTTIGAFGTSTFFGNLSVRGIATTTGLVVSNARNGPLSTDGAGNVTASTTGLLTATAPLTLDNSTRQVFGGAVAISCASCSTSGYPFTPLTNYNQIMSATTSPLWGRVGLFGSSTSAFDQINVGSTTLGTMSTSTFYGNIAVQGLASTTNLIISSLGPSAGQCLTTNAFGQIGTTACSSGGAGNWFTPTTAFGTAANATGTLIGFNAGLYSLASSTIGGGSAGLTIAGNATTSLNHAVLNNLLVGATSTGILTQYGAGTLFLFNTNQSGASPSLILGGNPSGDTDFWLSRVNDNATDNDDVLQLGIGVTPGATPASTWTYQGRQGLGSTTPLGLLTLHVNPTDLTTNVFPFIIGSSTAAATTTLFSVSNTGIASTSGGLVVSSLNSANCDVKASVAGVFSCGSDQGSFPFTPTTNFNIAVQATTGIPWFQNGLQASSTSRLSELFVGSTSPNQTPVFTKTPFSVIGTTSGIQQEVIINRAVGTNNQNVLLFGNDITTNSTYQLNIGFNSSTFSNTSFGGASGAYIFNTDGALLLGAATSSTAGYLSINTGAVTPVERLRVLSSGFIGIGTTSPIIASLTISSSTAPQILLTDAGLSNIGSSIRALNGWTYFATTTNSGIATSTFNSLTISPRGQVSTGEYVSTSSAATINIDWDNPNQVVITVPGVGLNVSFTNASTTGMTKRIVACNTTGAAGSLTWSVPGPTTTLLWTGGTVPTNTTTANKCDVYSFITTKATSTQAGFLKIFGTQTPSF